MAKKHPLVDCLCEKITPGATTEAVKCKCFASNPQSRNIIINSLVLKEPDKPEGDVLDDLSVKEEMEKAGLTKKDLA